MAGNDSFSPRFRGLKRSGFGVKTQSGFLFLRAVTLEAMLLEDRTNISGKIDTIRTRSRRNQDKCCKPDAANNKAGSAMSIRFIRRSSFAVLGSMSRIRPSIQVV